ncbi:MAG: hypothetical protein ACKOSQ_08680 [Planctomycetaceae bacterium]
MSLLHLGAVVAGGLLGGAVDLVLDPVILGFLLGRERGGHEVAGEVPSSWRLWQQLDREGVVVGWPDQIEPEGLD